MGQSALTATRSVRPSSGRCGCRKSLRYALQADSCVKRACSWCKLLPRSQGRLSGLKSRQPSLALRGTEWSSESEEPTWSLPVSAINRVTLHSIFPSPNPVWLVDKMCLKESSSVLWAVKECYKFQALNRTLGSSRSFRSYCKQLLEPGVSFHQPTRRVEILSRISKGHFQLLVILLGCC